jgi:ATP-binding cassette subfamily B protein
MYGRTFLTSLTLVGSVGTAVVYLIGGHLVVSRTISLGTLIALGAFVTQIYSPLTSLSNARVDLMTAFVSFDRVFEVLDAPIAITDRPGAYDLIAPTGRIELDGVWFTYPSGPGVSIASLESDAQHLVADTAGRSVLRNVSAVIEPGQLVALVGPSGAGKTTISQLLPRMYDVTGGRILVGGQDVRSVTQQSLRDRIGVVSQEAHMFHDTIRANLAYAAPDASDEQLWRAIDAAQIGDLVRSLPDGLDTVVGDRGYRLSGGEKARLAIARLLLKEPEIVVLDEATAHLDSESEAAVQEALSRALAGRTSLVIAHRLSTILSADTVIVLEAGRVVESGTHADLLARGGLYAELYRTQFTASPDPEPDAQLAAG